MRKLVRIQTVGSRRGRAFVNALKRPQAPCRTSNAQGQPDNKESELNYIVQDIPMVFEHLCKLNWEEILSGDLARLLIDFLPVLNEVITDRAYSPECRHAAQMIREKLAAICGVDLIGLLPDVWDMSKTALRAPVYYFGRAFDERREKNPTAYRAVVAAFKAAAPLLIEQLREGLQASKFEPVDQPPKAGFPDESSYVLEPKSNSRNPSFDPGRQQAVNAPGPLTQKGAASSSSQPANNELVRLEAETPAFQADSPLWVKNKVAAKLSGLNTRTLATYRKQGIANAEKTLGRDRNGRVWRRPGTTGSHPWYLSSTLENPPRNRG